VVMVVRHRTAPFAFNDAMWAKYGKAFSDRMEFTDPKTHEPPTTNLYAGPVGALLKQGVHLAVCSLTTRSYSQRLAEQAKSSADEVFKELTSNTIGTSHFVPAGVVAVTRAQEHGYVLVSVG
jgi:intracellular sulfur oxidation DsrE/DsrF family protein